MGIKDNGSFAFIDKNTFYENNFAIACFEKNLGKGGGSAEIKNSILANSLISSVLTDEFSTSQISYCLSNTEILNGTNNLFNDPYFVNAGIRNFELKSASPCIDSGDPLSPPDNDGTLSDIGAYYNFQQNLQTVLINEIF